MSACTAPLPPHDCKIVFSPDREHSLLCGVQHLIPVGLRGACLAQERDGSERASRRELIRGIAFSGRLTLTTSSSKHRVTPMCGIQWRHVPSGGEILDWSTAPPPDDILGSRDFQRIGIKQRPVYREPADVGNEPCRRCIRTCLIQNRQNSGILPRSQYRLLPNALLLIRWWMLPDLPRQPTSPTARLSCLLAVKRR